MTRRRVLAVTGIRSEYDILSSVFRAVEARSDLELQVFVCGAHLAEAAGRTVAEVRADGFPIADECLSLLAADDPLARVKGLGVQLMGLTQTVARLRPDWLVVLGDREESISTALVGAYADVPVAHLCGGDLAIGNVDDQVRHAVTKLAHLHLVTNRDSAERIRRLGEQDFRIHDVGNPGLDRLLDEPPLDDAELARAIGIELPRGAPLVVVIQHVISSEHAEGYAQMQATCGALRELALPAVVIHPNTDAGSEGIRRAIAELAGSPGIATARNLPRRVFVNLLRRASCLLGNSSAGILEAPTLGLPTVNVGNRQLGRLHGGNVQFVPHEPAAIATAVRRAVHDEGYRAAVAAAGSPYGDGQSGPRVARLLAETPIDRRLLVKEMTY
jgi:GDP/UDP-N,N'-diacetylbacillosamine 2-epimerase (hydrolysing)